MRFLPDFTIDEHEPAVDAKTRVDLEAFLASLSALPQAAAQIWRTLLSRPVGPRPSLRFRASVSAAQSLGDNAARFSRNRHTIAAGGGPPVEGACICPRRVQPHTAHPLGVRHSEGRSRYCSKTRASQMSQAIVAG